MQALLVTRIPTMTIAAWDWEVVFWGGGGETEK